MTYRTTITLEADVHDYLVEQGGKNRSAFINKLIRKAKEQHIASQMLQANLEEAADLDYQAELACWDQALEDGLP